MNVEMKNVAEIVRNLMSREFIHGPQRDRTAITTGKERNPRRTATELS